MNHISSQAVVLNRDDIDTDLIIPAEYLRQTTKDGMAKGLFARLRQSEKDFPLNSSLAESATILIAGKNFGCGSSREHAVWALTDWGFRAVIAESFADIFHKNAVNNTLLLIQLSEAEITMLSENKYSEISVNLEEQIVADNKGNSFKFEIDGFTKELLIKDIDEMEYLISKSELIESHIKRNREHQFARVESL